jgi:DNA-binding transcriptional regulator YhcF (GntR family)
MLDITASLYYNSDTVTRANRALHVDPAAAAPLWSQIEEGVRRLVASGTMVPGSVVPSVRDLARELRVNPATVSKAYQRLTDSGVLEVRRGDGTYVSAAPPSLPRAERSRDLREAALRYASLAATYGVAREEALDELRSAWSELGRARKGETG